MWNEIVQITVELDLIFRNYMGRNFFWGGNVSKQSEDARN